MKTTTQTELLDALRTKHGSDAASARALGITKQAVSLLRRNNTADDATITAACALLDRPAGLYLARHRADHASDPATAAAWADVVAQLAGSTANKPPPPSQPLPENTGSSDCHNSSGIRIMCTLQQTTRGSSQASSFTFGSSPALVCI